MRAGLLALAIGMAGCGTPGPPLPPSLNLPEPVTDLSAVRTGDQVKLTWTMPRRTTDKVNLKGLLPVDVCRRQESGACVAAAHLQFAPGAEGTFTEVLQGALAAGAPRPIRYFIELKNSRGRSAGLSNAAEVLAGQAPDAVSGLTAEVRRQGVALHWSAEAAPDAIRLHRTLLTPPQTKKHEGILDTPPAPVEMTLLVARDEGRALDSSVELGKTYQYRAQRVAHLEVDGKTLELAGPVSAPIRIEAEDVFPPARPTGLAAVATPASAGAAASIDLNWQPVADADLAGYIVYRREGDGAWTRISPMPFDVAPAYRDEHVEAGHTYRYAVSAVGRNGRESARSAAAEETVPNS